MDLKTALDRGWPVRPCYNAHAHESHAYERETDAPGLLEVYTAYCPGKPVISEL